MYQIFTQNFTELSGYVDTNVRKVMDFTFLKAAHCFYFMQKVVPIGAALYQ